MSDQAANPVSETPESMISLVKVDIKTIQDFAGGLPHVEEKIKETRKSIEDAVKQVTEETVKFSAIQFDARTKASEMQTAQSELQKKMEAVNTLQESLKNISDAIQNLQKQAEDSTGKAKQSAANILNIKKECEDARTTAQAVLAEVTAKKNQFEMDFKNLQSAVTSAQNTLNTLSEHINLEKAAAATITAQFQQQYLDAQEKRLNEFNTYMKGAKEAIEALKAKASDGISEQQEQLKKAVDDKVTELSSRVEVALQSMEEKNQKASKLFEAVGVKTHTYNYAAVSEKEETTANGGELCFL